MALKIADKEFTSRLFTGTGKFASNQLMEDAILASESQLVTVALKRVNMDGKDDDILAHLKAPHITLLPNTSGVRTAKEAVFAAQLAREALGTNWLKLEIHPDPKYLLPDPIETLKATEELAKLGFVVLPYIQADPVLCKHLENAGAATVMPLGAPIGTNKGLVTRDLLEIARLAQEREAKLILITRFPKSPGAALADIVLECGAKEGPLQMGSIAARMGQLYLTDVLFNEMCRRDMEGCRERRRMVADALADKHL